MFADVRGAVGKFTIGGVAATGGSMSLTSDSALGIVRLSGGWGGTLSVGKHIPLRVGRDMKSSQFVPLIN